MKITIRESKGSNAVAELKTKRRVVKKRQEKDKHVRKGKKRERSEKWRKQ